MKNFIILIFFLYQTLVVKSLQCGYKCSQCDIFKNCSLCEKDFILNQEKNICYSKCGEKNFYLTDESSQTCEPVCQQGYQEQTDQFICTINQRCPQVEEFGRDVRTISNTIFIQDQVIVLSKITASKPRYYFRIYDLDLNLQGEIEEDEGQLKQIIDKSNNILITVSINQLKIWEIGGWEVKKSIKINTLVQNTKYVSYLDSFCLIVQDQTEKVFTILYLSDALQSTSDLPLEQFQILSQEGYLNIKRVNKFLFYQTSSNQQGFFERQIQLQNPQDEQQYCQDIQGIQSIYIINENLILFFTQSNLIGIWMRGQECRQVDIGIPLGSSINEIVIISVSQQLGFVIVQSQSMYIEIMIAIDSGELSISKSTQVEGNFELNYIYDHILMYSQYTFKIFSIQDQQITPILSYKDEDNIFSSYISIFYANDNLYFFKDYQMYIAQNKPNQLNQDSSTLSEPIQFQMRNKFENINFWQLSSSDITGFAIDDKYQGQLVVISNDGSLRVYEQQNQGDLNYVLLFAQYHPKCPQDTFSQKCFNARNITISDQGYYSVIYYNDQGYNYVIWERKAFSLNFLSSYSLDNAFSDFVNYNLVQNYLLLQNKVQIIVFDIQTNLVVVNETKTNLYYSTIDYLWGNWQLIYLLNDRISIRRYIGSTATSFEKLYTAIYNPLLNTYYSQFQKAQYFSNTKILAFHNYYTVILSNLLPTTPTFVNVFTATLRDFCFHPYSKYTLMQNKAFKQVQVSDSVGKILYSQIVSGFFTAFCGTSSYNIFYYYITPLVKTLQNTVYLMTMPNFELNHIISFPKTIQNVIVDENELILYVGFTDGDIYVTRIILNFRINMSDYTNVSDFIYSQKYNYFIIYNKTDILIVDSLSLKKLKQFSTPNQSAFKLIYNEDLEIIVLYQQSIIFQWSVKTGQLDQYPIFHTTPLVSCYVDSTQGVIISYSSDFQMAVWDITSITMLFSIGYHFDDYQQFNNNNNNQQIFNITQIILLQNVHLLVTSNNLNKVYIHDLISKDYQMIQFLPENQIFNIKYDSLNKYLYYSIISDYSFTDIYTFLQSQDKSSPFFSFKKRINDSSNKNKLAIKFVYDQAFIYEKRGMTVLDRSKLTIQFSFTTFNPQISDFLIFQNLRYIVFWSDCSIDLCSPKVMIYSLDNGEYISEVPYSQQSEQGMILKVIGDESTNLLTIFKITTLNIILLFDIQTFATIGLFNNLSDSYSLPLKSIKIIQQTQNLIIFSGNSIIAYQIEHMLSPYQRSKSILPNRVQKFKQVDERELFFYDSQSQGWQFNWMSKKIKNILGTNVKNKVMSIKYYFEYNNCIYILLNQMMYFLNSNQEKQIEIRQEIDKAMQFDDKILITDYDGNVVIFYANTLTEYARFQVGKRIKQVINISQQSQNSNEISYQFCLLDYNNQIYTYLTSLVTIYNKTDKVFVLKFDEINQILMIFFTNGKIQFIHPQNLRDSSSDPNELVIQLDYTILNKIVLKKDSNIFAALSIPPNLVPTLYFYEYTQENQTFSLKLSGQISSISRSISIHINFLQDRIFIFTHIQIIEYDYQYKQIQMFINASQFANIQKIIPIDPPYNDIEVFFAIQENGISLFSYQTTLIQLYTHLCITPTLIQYQLNEASDGFFQLQLVALCDETVISDIIYLSSLLTPINQLQQCYIESNSQYQYQYIQTLKNLETSLTELKANPTSIHIDQMQQTKFGDYTSNRKISLTMRNLDDNTKNILKLNKQTFSTYGYSEIKIQSYIFDMSYLFESLELSTSIKEISLSNIEINFYLIQDYSINSNSQLLFQDMNLITITNMTIKNYSLKRDKPLFYFLNCNQVFIDNLIIENLEIYGSDPTLFYFYNIENLSISNVIIQQIDLKMKSAEQNQQIIYLEFVRNLVLSDFNMKTISSSFIQTDIFLIKGNSALTMNNILFNDGILTKLLQSQNYYLEKDSEILVTLNAATLTNVNVQNIKNLQDSLIFFNQTHTLEINKSTFQDIQCQDCIGGAIQVYKGFEHLITENLFQNISSKKGGALSILECSDCKVEVSSSNFLGNTASMYGGAIYIQNSMVSLESCAISNNKAMIGGGIKYTLIKPIIYLQDKSFKNKRMASQDTNQSTKYNTFQGNQGVIYGQNIGSYLVKIQIISPILEPVEIQQIQQKYGSDILNQILSSSKLSEFRSGNSINLEIQLLDEEDNPVTFSKDMVDNKQYDEELLIEIKGYSIKVEAFNNQQLKVFGKYTSDYSQFNEKNKSFIISGMIIVSDPLTSNIIKLSSDSLQKFDEVTRQIDTLLSSKIFGLLEVQTRNCIQGEVFQMIDHVYQCYECIEGQYSLIIPTKQGKFYEKSCLFLLKINMQYKKLFNLNNQKKDQSVCLKCPSTSDTCQKSQIILKEGYWRENNETDSIVSCSRMPQNCVPDEQHKYCIQGHYGPLCEQCDSYGKIWNQRYLNDGDLNCYPCGDLKNKPYYTYLFIYLVLLKIFIMISISSSLYNSKSIVRAYYLRRSQMISVYKSAYWNSFAFGIKALVNYLMLSALIYLQIQIDFPYYVRLLSSKFGMPLTNMLYSLDCHLSNIHGLEIIYLRTIWSLLIPIAQLIFISLFLIIYGKMRKQKIQTLLINGAVFIFYYTQNNIIYQLFSMLSCRKIDGNHYIVSDITYKCYTTTHQKFILFIGLPGIIISIFIIPYCLFKKIKQKQDKLNSANFRLKYGNIYNDYKNQYYYWDFIKSYKQILITAALTFYSDPVDNKLYFGLLIQLLYVMKFRNIKPFLNNDFYKVELMTEIILMLQFILSIFLVQKNDTSQGLEYYIFKNVSLVTEGFLILWTAKQFVKSKYFIEYNRFKKTLLIKFPFLSKFTKIKQIKYGMNHLLVWKKLKRLVLLRLKFEINQSQPLTLEKSNQLSDLKKKQFFLKFENSGNSQDKSTEYQSQLLKRSQLVSNKRFQKQHLFEKQQSSQQMQDKNNFLTTQNDEQNYMLKDTTNPQSPQLTSKFHGRQISDFNLASNPTMSGLYQSSPMINSKLENNNSLIQNNEIFKLDQIDLVVETNSKQENQEKNLDQIQLNQVQNDLGTESQRIPYEGQTNYYHNILDDYQTNTNRQQHYLKEDDSDRNQQDFNINIILCDDQNNNNKDQNIHVNQILNSNNYGIINTNNENIEMNSINHNNDINNQYQSNENQNYNINNDQEDINGLNRQQHKIIFEEDSDEEDKNNY